jgi:tRNA A37 threonylcarbamoyladenosine modification protein TsaB
MSKLIFKMKKAKEHGRSGIEIVLKDKNKVSKSITDNTDNLLQTLDKLLKRNKIELESLNDIKVEIEKGAGLTSTRIVSSIVKALSLDL